MAREKAKDPRKDAPAKGRPAKAKDKSAPVIESPAATPLDAEVRRTRLKTLITLGKERGYLTYAEISDHLPDDVADAGAQKETAGLPRPFRYSDVAMDQNLYLKPTCTDQRDSKSVTPGVHTALSAKL